MSKFSLFDKLNEVAQKHDKSYVVLKELGKGAFGKVVSANEYDMKTKTTTKVAIKYTITNISEKQEIIGELESEKIALENLQKQCKDQYVLCYRDFFVYLDVAKHKKISFLVTELLEDYFTLFNYMQTNAKLHTDKKIDYTEYYQNIVPTLINNMITGIRYIHSAGYIHGDLKPGNIMINQYGQIKIIDFGASCSIDKCISKEYGQTVSYIAPEIWELIGDNQSKNIEDPFFKPIEFQIRQYADLWAIGIIALELITFSYENFFEVVKKHLRELNIDKKLMTEFSDNVFNYQTNGIIMKKINEIGNKNKINMYIDIPNEVKERLEKYGLNPCFLENILKLVALNPTDRDDNFIYNLKTNKCEKRIKWKISDEELKELMDNK